ncbi:hypothetical protein ABC347_07725 [Sphingomonas sp. 1P06PA]|uniref:hypothetical protein n=1 Tax=Sphingomonas sp. 1P06PA TaxID=554121 RepID=UPI0039A74596
MSDAVIKVGESIIAVTIGGPPGPRGLPSGPLADETVGVDEIKAAEATAIVGKLGLSAGTGGTSLVAIANKGAGGSTALSLDNFLITVDARQFGASVGASAATNRAAIQAALDWVATNKGGGTVQLVGIFPIDAMISIPHQVKLVGAQREQGGLIASSTFPATAMVKLGVGEAIVFRVQAVNLVLDGNNRPGTTGIWTTKANEGCRIEDVLIRNYGKHGVHVQGSFVGLGIRDVECYPSATQQQTTSTGVKVEATAGISLANITVVGARGNDASPFDGLGENAFKMQNAFEFSTCTTISAKGLHGERCNTVVACLSNSGGTLDTVDGFTTDNNVNTVVFFNGGTEAWTLRNIVKGGSVHTIVDNLTATTIDDATVQDYVQGRRYLKGTIDAAGFGSPEGVVTGGIGSTYRDLSAGGQYTKTTNGNTGWKQLMAAVVLNGSTTYDPPSLINNSASAGTITVAGAALGDFVQASFSNSLQGVRLSAYVSAADTVAFRFDNNNNTTVDLASGTVRVRVTKP